MLVASLKSVLGRKLRLLMSAIAVVLGVAFVAGSFVFTDTLAKSFDGIMHSTVGDVVVRPKGSAEGSSSTQTLPASLVSTLASAPGAARADGNVTDLTTFVVSKEGKLIGGQGAPGMGVNYSDGPAANGNIMFKLTQGAWPSANEQIVLDARTATAGGYAVGDAVQVVTAGTQAQLKPTLTGIMEPSGSLLGASVVVWTTGQAQQVYLGGRDEFSDIWVTRKDGTSQEQLRAEVAPLLPSDVEAVTGTAAAEAAQSQIQESLKFITYFLLIFAGVALVVGSFIIVNTFSILVAQRMKELALFRAIGASRKQVSRSVLVEAAIVGLIGSTLGLLAGLGLAVGIKVLFGSIGLDLSGASLVIEPRTIVAAYAVGLVVTLLAAYLPARKAGRVAPVAAMRDEVTMAEGSMRGRVLVGAVLAGAGAAAMFVGLFTEATRPPVWIGIGILGVLLGVALTSPLVGRPLITGMGALYRRGFGSVGVMAQENALRNPRRTAATASALMIGVTLVSMMAVFGASTKKTIDEEINKSFKADYLVSNSIGQDFSPSVGDEFAAVPGVGTVSRVRWGSGTFEGTDTWMAAVDPATFGKVATLDDTKNDAVLAELATGGVLLDVEKAESLGLKAGETVTLTLQGKEYSTSIAGLFTPSVTAPAQVILGLDDWTAHGGRASDAQVYVLAENGADVAAVGSALERIVADLPMISVKDVAGYAQEQADLVNQMLMIIYALLGLAVIIAILGIINTLALSVIERTREIGLLRAVGLSRAQLRTMLRLESVVIAILGAVLGLVLGVAFGIAIQRALADEGFSALSIPWLQLLGFLLLAAVVGVLASVWPGRRAARMQILDAISAE